MSSTTVPKASAAHSGLWLVRKSTQVRLRAALAYALLTLGGIGMALPLAWMVSSSLKGPGEIFLLPLRWIPDPVRWENYREVLVLLPFFHYLTNTLIIAVLATLGQLITAAMSAYAFARLRWPGRDQFFAVLLATMMLPYAVTLIPTFLLFRSLGWLDTFLPLIVPYWFGGGPFYIFLLRQFFLKIPMELEEAARIDGASSARIFVQLILPLAKPALVVVAIFAFLSHWNDFLGPLVYLTSNENRTLALGLAALQGLQWGRDATHLVMAVSILMISPIIAMFLLAQRVFVEGIVLTGLKG